MSYMFRFRFIFTLLYLSHFRGILYFYGVVLLQHTFNSFFSTLLVTQLYLETAIWCCLFFLLLFCTFMHIPFRGRQSAGPSSACALLWILPEPRFHVQSSMGYSFQITPAANINGWFNSVRQKGLQLYDISEPIADREVWLCGKFDHIYTQYIMLQNCSCCLPYSWY